MELICSACQRTIHPDNINISSDLAKCNHCNAVHKASELETRESVESVPFPKRSKIVVNTGFGDSLEIFYPKHGFKAVMIFYIFFALFWLSFVGFWTWGALRGGMFFALFSIPFWIVGISMVIGIINAMGETQTIKISRSKLIIEKHRPIGSKHFEYNVRDIDSVSMTKHKMKSSYGIFSQMNLLYNMQGNIGTGGLHLPAVKSGESVEYFLEAATEAEHKWVVAVVDGVVQGVNF